MPDSLEDRIMSMLQSSKDCTLSQTELGKTLSLTSREIYRPLLKLERRGIIERIKSEEGGRVSYKIKLLRKKQKIDLNDVVWCSCLTCADLERCGRGQPVSPEACAKLTASIRAEHSRLSVLGEEKDAQ